MTTARRRCRTPRFMGVLALVTVTSGAVLSGCAGVEEAVVRERPEPTREYDGPARQRAEEGGGNELDLSGGRYRDPLGPQRRVQPSQRAWREIFRDDFDGDTLDTSVWRTYGGVPGCCPQALWDASMVRVADGSLHLDTSEVDGRWLSGGVGSWDSVLEQQYGRYDVRLRTDADGLGVTVAALLWPAYGGWPPEIDFYEIFETEPDRREMTITNHYGEIEADGTHDATRRPVRADFAEWRVMSVRWTADEIQVVMDGRVVETIRNPAQIPDLDMWLALQTAVKYTAQGAPAFDGVRTTEVDWVRVYEPA